LVYYGIKVELRRNLGSKRMRKVGLVLLSLTLLSVGTPHADEYFTEDEIIQVLRPAPLTRSLTPGTGKAPAPGTTGSGSIPDLRILFPFNSAELTPDAQSKLDVLGRALVSDELLDFRFEVAGHTDAVGSESYNLSLSERRAQAVTGYLERKFGIRASRLVSKGYGKAHLLIPTDGANAKNRRVEIVTLQ
jgi:outer membrane protein OmpA-like peptidoglycan-associated protein